MSKSGKLRRTVVDTRTREFDATDYLVSEPAVAAYLEAALEQNDATFFQKALGTVARARGMQKVAAQSDTTRAGLYKALSEEGNPEFATVQRVVNALGYRLTVVRAGAKQRAPARRVKAATANKPRVGKRPDSKAPAPLRSRQAAVKPARAGRKPR